MYAIEASDICVHAQKLFDANPALGARITLLRGKLETLTLPETADVLISEPMGTLLVNERMLETYVYARDHMLKPGGAMFPSLGRVYVAAFTDAALHAEQLSMAAFWHQEAFYGVDLRALHSDAQAVRFILRCCRVHNVCVCMTCARCIALRRRCLARRRRVCLTVLL